MKIQKIYDKYKIMPQLQLHMLRVTGVATLIVENFRQDIDKNVIITVCLLHDIGNIVKFNLKKFPENLKPYGYEYWKNVQNEFIDKYGKSDYEATYGILKELNIPKKLFGHINTMEFRKAPENAKRKDSFEIKITQYSDMRVAPYGVANMEERLNEVQRRFMRNHGISDREFNKYRDGVQTIENQIFNNTNISPEDITDGKVARLIPELRNYDIESTSIK